MNLVPNITLYLLVLCMAVIVPCLLWKHRKESCSKIKSYRHKARHRLALLQDISLALLLLFFWAPFHLYLFFLCISACIAFAFVLLVPRRAIDFRFLKQSISLLLIYLLLWISVSYTTYKDLAVVYCLKQTVFLLVPLVFCGMTPRYFSPKRLSFFALCFVAGCILLFLIKVTQLVYCFNIVWPYFNTQYAINTRNDLLYIINEFLSSQATYFSWANLHQVMHTITESLVFNVAFTLVFTARVLRHPFLRSRFKKCLADFVMFLFAVVLITSSSKTGQGLFAVNLLLSLIFAFGKKRWRIAYGLSAFLLLMGVLGFHYFGMGISFRFEKSMQVAKELKAKEQKIDNDGSLLPRVYCWISALEMAKEKPIFGFGSGFLKEYKDFFDARYPFYKRETWHPHNQFLIMLLANGILGLLIFLLFWVQAIYLVWKNHNLWGWIWILGLFLICSIDTIFYQVARFYCCLPYCFLMAENYNLKLKIQR